MIRYKEILRLRNLGYSQRQIAMTGVASRDKVREVVAAAERLGIE